MMAGLVDSQSRTVYCGSTIIATKYVLSAAHCVIKRNPLQLGVLVGDHDLMSGKPFVKIHQLEEKSSRYNWVMPSWQAKEKRDFREFFVENVMYIFYNYLLILREHIFSNSQ